MLGSFFCLYILLFQNPGIKPGKVERVRHLDKHHTQHQNCEVPVVGRVSASWSNYIALASTASGSLMCQMTPDTSKTMPEIEATWQNLPIGDNPPWLEYIAKVLSSKKTPPWSRRTCRAGSMMSNAHPKETIIRGPQRLMKDCVLDLAFAVLATL